MASCAVCGTGLREGATHCTTCGTPTGASRRRAGRLLGPSPFESETSWIDLPSPFETAANWETAGAPPPAAVPLTVAPPRSRPVTVIVTAALVAVVAALVALGRRATVVPGSTRRSSWATGPTRATPPTRS